MLVRLSSGRQPWTSEERGRNAATDSGEAIMATRLRSLVLHGRAVRADGSGEIRLLDLPVGRGGVAWAMRGVIKPK